MLALGSEAAPGDDVMTGPHRRDPAHRRPPRAPAARSPSACRATSTSSCRTVAPGSTPPSGRRAPRARPTRSTSLLGIEPDVVAGDRVRRLPLDDGRRRRRPGRLAADLHDRRRRRRGAHAAPTRSTREQALDYARTRDDLPAAATSSASANHQRLLLGVLERLRAAEDEEGFMESGRAGRARRAPDRPVARRGLPARPGAHDGRPRPDDRAASSAARSGWSSVPPSSTPTRPRRGRSAPTPATTPASQGGCRDGSG